MKRTDASGNRYVSQLCLDGSIQEAGTNPRTGSIWQSTIFPDGSRSGSNNCGVSWSYSAVTDRYETSLGEKGMGRNVFLANFERINHCEARAIQ